MLLNYNTQITSESDSVPVENIVRILRRDIENVFFPVEEIGDSINLRFRDGLKDEEYVVQVGISEIDVYANDDLGFIYGALFISEKMLGVKPFWFWMDQEFKRKEKLSIEKGQFNSPERAVRFRGWFFNDEVLFLKWTFNENKNAFKMGFEALLRCGGNMVIPGTDKLSRENRQLAADYGLYITHHHAEPLGAELFAREYPDLQANYLEHEAEFLKLWEDGVKAQKDMKVVWNLCFRGQGDNPFWLSDTTGAFDTDEKRGAMITSVIRKQMEIVKKYVENPIFCINLYGEVMELYDKGFVAIDDPNIIKVKADNGYGAMVTRRRDEENLRVNAMPDPNDKSPQGIYYHVSFYDLQAANHLVQLPNSVEFVNRTLHEVLEKGGKDFWVVNCSNVRPHTYMLDAVAKIWNGQAIDDKTQSQEFARDYYSGNERIAKCYEEYPQVTIAYGKNEDEHAGEQFYNDPVRILSYYLLIDNYEFATGMVWLTGEKRLAEQIEEYGKMCRDALPQLESYLEECHRVLDSVGNRTFHDNIMLQATLHYYGALGVATFALASKYYFNRQYEEAFVAFGRARECYQMADAAMRSAEEDLWQDFYLNECFADYKYTAVMIGKIMGKVRVLGDNIRNDMWYRKFTYDKVDQGIFLQLTLDNHMTDEEIYRVMKGKVAIERIY